MHIFDTAYTILEYIGTGVIAIAAILFIFNLIINVTYTDDKIDDMQKGFKGIFIIDPPDLIVLVVIAVLILVSLFGIFSVLEYFCTTEVQNVSQIPCDLISFMAKYPFPACLVTFIIIGFPMIPLLGKIENEKMQTYVACVIAIAYIVFAAYIVFLHYKLY